jgi:hypothetical protein
MKTLARLHHRYFCSQERSDRPNLRSLWHRFGGRQRHPRLREPWAYLGGFGDDFFDEDDDPFASLGLCSES